MGRQNLCVSAQSWENLFTVFDLNPGRLSFVDNWILNICVIALSWENLFSVFEVFNLNLRYIIHH